MISPTHKKARLITLANELYLDGRKAVREGQLGKAAEFYFQAADVSYREEAGLFAARLYCLSFLAQIQDDRYLKDKPNLAYLGRFEEILNSDKRFDMLVEGHKQIGEQLRRLGQFNLSIEFYLKEMVARKKYNRQQGRLVLWFLYWLWGILSSYGESPFRLLVSVIVFSLIQAAMLMPAPFKSMEAIRVVVKDFQLESYLDYWYMGVALVFSWDWKAVQPVNSLGLLIVCFRFLVSFTLVALLVNLLVRKLSSR